MAEAPAADVLWMSARFAGKCSVRLLSSAPLGFESLRKELKKEAVPLQGP